MNAHQFEQAHGVSQHHLNQDYVLELLADDLALVQSLLTNYLQMSPDEMAGLKRAIESADTALIKQHAHRLRGLLRYFGAQDLEDMLLDRHRARGTASQLSVVHRGRPDTDAGGPGMARPPSSLLDLQ